MSNCFNCLNQQCQDVESMGEERIYKTVRETNKIRHIKPTTDYMYLCLESDINCYRGTRTCTCVHDVYILASVGFAEARPTDVQTSSLVYYLCLSCKQNHVTFGS